MTKPIPEHPGRVLLVNPTKYLGNLLLAGGLMQAFATYCQAQGIELKIVLDDSFRELCEHSFPEDSLIRFPRRAIARAGIIGKIILYLRCLKQIRTFHADLAFNIEEDAATSHLTRLSGARFKLGCSQARHKSGYDHVVAVVFENRTPGRTHRWYSFRDMFAVLGMPSPATPGYLAIHLPAADSTLRQRLQDAGVDFSRPLVAIHGGATKDYKKWPVEHYGRLCQLLIAANMQPVLLGAGAADQDINRRIVAASGRQQVVDLCNSLTLKELAQFLPLCRAMIGNDSGPSHLGAALGIPGLVLWGPTNKAIWAPLGKHSEIVQGGFPCDPACNKGHCLHDHRCLQEITPDQVFAKLGTRLS